MVSNAAGCLFVVATPIGNLDDITRRAARTLADVDVVVAEDTRHTRGLLEHLGITARMLALHDHNEETAAARVVESLEAGQDLALVSDAGTPLISDPGFGLVRACRQRGIRIVPIPGPCALTAALSVAGLPTDRFVFEGFPPRKPSARRSFFAGLSDEQATLVFYEAANRIGDSLEDMKAAFGDDRAAVLARELTKRFETIVSGSLAELAAGVAEDANQRRGEFVVLVAGAADTGTDLAELDRVLIVLLDELPLRQAAAIAARLLGCKRNQAYERALALQQV